MMDEPIEPGTKYICAYCHQEYEAVTTHEVAMAEMESFFGKVEFQDCEVVCDDCWNKIHPNRN